MRGSVTFWDFLGYASYMKDLFNKNFFRLLFGFLAILLLSFMFTAVVTNLDANTMSATVPAGN